jgi:hypothetical protein
MSVISAASVLANDAICRDSHQMSTWPGPEPSRSSFTQSDDDLHPFTRAPLQKRLEKCRKLMATLDELLFVAAFLFLASLGVAQAAQIFIGGMAWTGIPAIKIYGQIVAGDEQRFAATAATRQSSVVVLNSPGGDVDTAIAIGRIVRDLKFDTFVGRGGSGCWSACPLIWLSGRHAIV